MAMVQMEMVLVRPPNRARRRKEARAGDARRAAVLPPGRVHARQSPAMRACACVCCRRGRFVAFATTSAPSWYVFCADAYRIPGNADVMPMLLTAPPVPAPQPLPPARVVRRRRPPMQWDEVATWLLIAIFVVVVGWHGLHLQLPHR
jgi:hypothetical protein